MSIKDRASVSESLKGGGAVNIEDMFSTYVYTGNGAAGQTITTGIDLVNNDGLVWIKNRTGTIRDHILVDTINTATSSLRSNQNYPGSDRSLDFTGFTSSGFSVDLAQTDVTNDTVDYVSWTFKKQPRFFDMVKYTGNGVAGREIAHDLGCDVGMMIVKNLGIATEWFTYHRGNTANPETQKLYLNTTAATASELGAWNDTAPTDSVFTVGTRQEVNFSGNEYIAYLYAHDPLGASGDGSDGMIACGSYTGNTRVELGWEPQYLLIKRTDSAYDWRVVDVIRGMPVGANNQGLKPNTSEAEAAIGGGFNPDATGFTDTYHSASGTYIYMAIRRPMKTPTSSDEVFAIDFQNPLAGSVEWSINTGFAVDMLYTNNTASSVSWCPIFSRLTGTDNLLLPHSTDAEQVNTAFVKAYPSDSIILGQNVSSNNVSMFWKRAKGFFDVVAYTGNGIAGRTVNHNLGVVPEMMWVKKRNTVASWTTYDKTNTATDFMNLNDDGASDIASTIWNDTEPTDAVFSVATSGNVNESASTYIAYLFATLAGISKVGSYTGNGTSQTIDCGFSTGCKFFLVKASSTTGDWHIIDATRGVVAGNDPYLELNTTNAEVTIEDCVDPDNSGIIVNEVAGSNINTNAVTYIFYAIANPL